jgi:hypothetical protein
VNAKANPYSGYYKLYDEAAARESGDADTLEAPTNAIEAHNTSEDAHTDIREGIANNSGKIKALQGTGATLRRMISALRFPSSRLLPTMPLQR